MWSKRLAIGVFLLLVSFLVGACGPPPPEPCACLYSGMDGMEILEDANWDINDPDAGSWGDVNIIAQEDAEDSDWAVRFPDLPWSFMYDSCAEWVYGNNDWDSPVSNDHEYYRVPLTVPVNGNCVMVRFQAYIDDGAKFYIDGPGFSGPTVFYEHDPDVSMDNHDPVGFWVDPDSPVPLCLGPGHYTIYIDHWDTQAVIYGLIFTAECIPCECPSVPGEHKMHYPQLPEAENGFSVLATLNAAAPYYVADDWQCSESGLVTDIHFWGHWDGLSTITNFEIAIAEKTDECDVGEILWQQDFPISEVSVSDYIPATPQGWYNPPADYNGNVGEGYWQYNIENIEDPFCQEEGEEYWLIIGAYVDYPNEGVWGWRNTESDHFGCRAMYSHSLTSGWQPMNEPPNYTEPLDMAFVITGGEPCEPCQCGEWGLPGVTVSSGDWQEAVNCGEIINFPLDPLIINAPPDVGAVEVSANYQCEGCEATYEWAVDPVAISGTCGSGPCEFGFELPEECVKVYISVFCGDTLCEEQNCFWICPE